MAHWFTKDIGCGMEIYKDNRGQTCFICNSKGNGDNPIFMIPDHYVGKSWWNDYHMCYKCAMSEMAKQGGTKGGGRIGEARKTLRNFMNIYNRKLSYTLVPGSLAKTKVTCKFTCHGQEFILKKGRVVIVGEELSDKEGFYGFNIRNNINKDGTLKRLWGGIIEGKYLDKIGHAPVFKYKKKKKENCEEEYG